MYKKLVNARVDSITPLTDRILQLILIPDTYIDYQAGQYLNVLYQGEEHSYSIANAPLGSHKYELHIRHSPNLSVNNLLIEEVKTRGYLTLRMPLGNCYLAALSQPSPLIFIAGGTGFAPIKAMIEQLLADSDPRNFELYWLARSKSDLYLNDIVDSWQTHVSKFKYFSLLSGVNQNSVLQLLNERHPKGLSTHQIVLSGPFDMVFNFRDKLVEQGVSPQAIFSDAFSFEQKKG